MNLLPLPEGATGSNHSQLDADEPDRNGCYLLVPTEKERKGDRESEKVFVWVKQTGEKGHEIYINLIMLLVPCVFLLEPTAGREWRDIDRKGDTEKETERDSLIH